MDFYIRLLLANAIFGILLFEFAWYKMRPVREVNETRDSKYPAFRRYDGPKWNKWRFYPGAMTMMIPRLLLLFSSLILVFIWTR